MVSNPKLNVMYKWLRIILLDIKHTGRIEHIAKEAICQSVRSTNIFVTFVSGITNQNDFILVSSLMLMCCNVRALLCSTRDLLLVCPYFKYFNIKMNEL